MRTRTSTFEAQPLHSISRPIPLIKSRSSPISKSSLKVVEYFSTPPSTVRVTITTPITAYPPAPVPPAPVPYLTYIPKNVPRQLMHQRLAHASAERMRLLGISYNLGKCQVCIMGKQTTKPFPKNPPTRKLFRVSSDICPVSPESFGHCLYLITFVDEATR